MFPIKTTIFFKQQSMTQPFKSVTLLEDFFGSEAGGKRRSHTGKMVLYRENSGKIPGRKGLTRFAHRYSLPPARMACPAGIEPATLSLEG